MIYRLRNGYSRTHGIPIFVIDQGWGALQIGGATNFGEALLSAQEIDGTSVRLGKARCFKGL